MKNNTQTKLIIALFTAFIAVMGLLYIFMPKNSFSYTEKRFLAKFPDVSWDNIKSGDFSEDFEKYLADHAPFRNAFVAMNSYFQLATGNNGSSGVYLGKDGYLIEKPFERDNKLVVNATRITDFTEKIGIKTTLVVVPSKGYILNDKLPANAEEYLDDEYCEAIGNLTKGKLTYIDLRDNLKEASADNEIFYHTDHHWTSDGAFAAYKEICKVLGFNTPNEDDYDIETTDGFYGTSYQSSGYTLTKPDKIKIYKNRISGGAAEVIISEGSKETTYENMFFTDNLKEPEGDIERGDTNANTGDKYTVYLDGNHSLVRIKTGNEGKKMLLIKDSFAHCLAPFLAENYSEIIMIDQRYYRSPVSSIIESEGIDEIMFVYGIENLATDNNIILR